MLITTLVFDDLLLLSLVTLIFLFAFNVRKDYKKRAWLFGALSLVHIILSIVFAAVGKKTTDQYDVFILIPAIHTIDLLAIIVISIYFWIRNRLLFKSNSRSDLEAAFGGAVEQRKEIDKPVQPAEPKKARDEKTGIVSL